MKYLFARMVKSLRKEVGDGTGKGDRKRERKRPAKSSHHNLKHSCQSKFIDVITWSDEILHSESFNATHLHDIRSEKE